MTNKEINEYLAEHLFGWEETELGWLAPEKPKDFFDEYIYSDYPNNYIKKWQQVVRK